MSDELTKTYIKLIKRKKYYFISVFGFLILIGALSFILSERVVFIIACVYVTAIIGWTLFLYYSMCPECYGLFYGPSPGDKNIINLKFFLNNECNNCGFKVSKNT